MVVLVTDRENKRKSFMGYMIEENTSSRATARKK